jgi:hypothetical protein
MLATAPPAARLLLVEVPGPWGRAGLAGSRLPGVVTRPLAAAADAAGVRVQLLRAPGRHAVPRVPGAEDVVAGHAWALADPRVGVVRWGRWSAASDLLAIDLHATLDAADAGTGPQRLALVCTHARHDVCCAVRGRPVAAELAAATDRAVWETSHLGGDRFAANVLLLPEGEVFGGLDVDSAAGVVRRLDAGHVTFEHYRGRVGRSPAVQAAVHVAAVALGDDRLGAVRPAGGAMPEGDRRVVEVEHHGDHGVDRLVVTLVESWAPAEVLSCSAVEAKPSRRFAVESVTAVAERTAPRVKESRRAG